MKGRKARVREAHQVDFELAPDAPTITVTLSIDNRYELYSDVATRASNRTLPAPPSLEEDALDEWSWETVYQFTGAGHTDGDSWYDVTVTASSQPELIGREFHFGY